MPSINSFVDSLEDKIRKKISGDKKPNEKFSSDGSSRTKFKSAGTRNGQDVLQLYQDPTHLCFKLLFINSDIEGAAGTIGLLGGPDNTNSALYYLKKMGDMARFNMLVDFKTLLFKLNSEYPWYFQSIEGLGDAWKRDLSKPKFTKELTINCLESIDLRITGLMDLYRKITIDYNNRRYILPENLRKFEMTVKLYDFRDFSLTTTGLERLGVLTKESAQTAVAKQAALNDSVLGKEDMIDRTQLAFDLTHCEFDPDVTGDAFGTISNAEPTLVEQKIKIKYQNIEENNIYRLLSALGRKSENYYVRDYLRSELIALAGEQQIFDPNDFPAPKNGPEDLSLLEKLKDKAGRTKLIGDALNDLGGNLLNNVSKRAADAVKSRLARLLLGNVYGLSPASLVNSVSSVDAVTDTFSAALNPLPEKEGNPKLGNVYGADTTNPPTPDAQGPVDLGNVYD